MSYEPEPEAYSPTDDVARSRVNTPGVLLVVVGVLNVLAGLYLIFAGATALLTPSTAEQIQQQQARMTPEQREQWQQMEKQGWDMQKLIRGGGTGVLIWGVVAVLCGLVTLFGGFQMRGLNGYGLAVFGSILALIPFISPMGCCILGEIAGIWGLVVLMSQDVKSAFR